MITSSPAAVAAAYAQWQAWLAQPAQMAARASSQLVYGGESSSQALNTDTAVYPGWIGQAGYQSLDLGGQGKIIGTPGKYSALVQNPDGSRGVMVSPAPLSGTTPSGSTAPLDLDLTSISPGNYEPQSSAVPVTLPFSSTGDLTFPQSGIGVQFASGAAAQGQQQGGTVFYPNVDGAGSDTDVVANATPAGAEVSYVLRSANSPQSQTLTFELPTGWSLTPSVANPGEVDVVDGSGAAQLSVPPAVAIDAQGQSVPVSYQLQGADQLVVTVSDQGGSFAFPIEVDPNFSVGDSGMFNSWQFHPTNATNFGIDPMWNSTLNANDDAGVVMKQYHPYIPPAGGGYTVYTPTGVNFYRYDLTGIYNAASTSNGVLLAGLQPSGTGQWNPSASWIYSQSVFGASSNTNPTNDQLVQCDTCSPNSSWDGDQASFGLEMEGTPTTIAESDATGGHLYFSDDGNQPTATVNSAQDMNEWVPSVSGTLLTTVSDSQPGGGLGVQSLSVTANGHQLTPQTVNNCYVGYSSNYTIGCQPLGGSYQFGFPASDLTNNSVNTITATATGYDGVQSASTSSSQYWIGVDPNAPVVTPSGGTLWGLGQPPSVVPLGAQATLAINVTESPSGIEGVQGFLDGNAISPTSGPTTCGGGGTNNNCAISQTYSANPSAAGWHQLSFSAFSWSWNQSQTYTNNFAEVAPPTISASTGFAVGDTLTATAAPFATNSYGSTVPSVGGWQWQSCDVQGFNCVNIPSATGNQYTLSSADVGSTIQVVETVNDPSGTTPSTFALPSGAQRSTPIEPAIGPACTDSWLGATGTWSTGTKWSTGVPQSTDVVCIRSGYSSASAVTVSSAQPTVAALDAYGASVVVDSGQTLTVGSLSQGSGVGNLTLGDSSGAGSLDATGRFTVQGVPGSTTPGLIWANGSILGGGTVTLKGASSSQIAPISSSASIALNGETLVNNGTLQMSCSTANDTTNTLTDLVGQGAAVLNNQGTLTFTGTSGAGDGCEFQQATSGSGTQFINGGTISEQNITAVNIGWPFESTEAATINSTTINLYGGQLAVSGQQQPISGHWNGSSALNFEAAGAYALTDDLADFGSQSGTTNVTVEPAPGSTGGATIAFTKFVAGLSGTPVAPSLTIAAGTWTYGTVTADGPLTLGQGGSVTTLGALVDSGSAPVTQAGPVDVITWTNNGVQISNPSSYAWKVWGPSRISGNLTFNGSTSSSMTFYGPVNVAQTPSITTTGSLTIYGAVSGTGPFTVNSGAAFYEQGGITSTGTVTVTAATDVQLSGAVTDLGAVSVTGTTGRVDISGGVNTQSLTATGTSISIEGAVGNQAALPVSLTTNAPGTITVTGQMSATSLTLATTSLTSTSTATLDSSSVSASTLTANGLNVYNEGTLTIGTKLYAQAGAQITNDGIVNADNASFDSDTAVSQFVNATSGQMLDPTSPNTQNHVLLPYGGSGAVAKAYLINSAGSNQYGGNNPAAPNMVSGACDQAADCGNGDWSTSETDMSMAALGGPLALTRQYSSRLAGSESTPGMFGYGWLTPFEQRLFVDASAGTATVRTTTGSSATYTYNSSTSSYTPGSGIWATLVANTDGTYTYTEPDGTTTKFNAAGFPTSVTNRQGQATTYTYNAQGQLTAVTSPSVAQSAGQPSVQSRAITFSYITSGPGTGQVWTATDPSGLQFTYQYDNNHNLTSVIESAKPGTGGGSGVAAASQTVWSYCYDGPVVNCNPANDAADLHELTTLTDANNNSTTITYQGGYVTGVQQPGATSAETWSYQENSSGTSGSTIQKSANTKNVTTFTFNSKDEPTQTQYSDGTTVNMIYNANGDLTGQQNGARLGTDNGGTCNPGGGQGWTCFTYDSVGNQNSQENPDGNTTTWTYNTGSGNPVTYHDLLSQTLPSGETTTYNLDAGGQPLSVTVSNPSVSGTPTETTQYAYYPDEQVQTKTTPAPNSGVTSYTYGAYGDVATVTTPATADFMSGTTTTYGYDADGRPICSTTGVVTALGQSCVTGPTTNAATSVYDGLGDLMLSTNPQGEATSYTYSPTQQVLQTTAPLSNTTNITTYLYCQDGQLEQTTIGNGTGTTAITQANTYDLDNNLTSQTTGASSNNCTTAPSGGQTYTYTYNSMDQMQTETPPSGLSSEQTSYTYDGDGNLKTVTYPANSSGTSVTTTDGYNGENQAIQRTYSDSEPTITKAYTPDGQLSTMHDGNGANSYTSYLYDGLDRLSYACVEGTSYTTVVGTCAGGRHITYGYNNDNDETSIGYPNGNTVNQGFNAADQLSSVTDWVGSGNQTNFHYDRDGNLVTTNFPSASSETDTYAYNYDDAMTGVTMKQTSATLASITLNRYADDLISSESTSGTPGLPGPTLDTYCYTQQQELALDITTASPNCATSTQSAYSYDSARNMTQLNGSGSGSLSYNADSELCWTSTTSSTNGCASPPTGAATYAYNPIGERKSLTPATGAASTYSYNADENLTQANAAGTALAYTYDGNGQLQSRTIGSSTQAFTWDNNASSPNLLAWGSNEYYIYGPGGNAIEQISSSGTVQYLHEDQIGSTRLITSNTGAVLSSFTYNPYGGVLAKTGTTTSYLGYAGQYTDEKSGLVYDQARWYDPATGQFMVVDPKVESTWQAYAYAGDDPLTNTDPTGLEMMQQIEASFGSSWGDAGTAMYIDNELMLEDGPPRGGSGNSPATKVGRYVHDQFKRKLQDLSKQDPNFKQGETTGPKRPDGWYQNNPIELKPDTSSGRSRGMTQLRGYMKHFDTDTGYLATYDPRTGELTGVQVVHR